MSSYGKNKNVCPVVEMNPTRYKGGISKAPEVVMNPTKYTGGLNKEACNIPKKK